MNKFYSKEMNRLVMHTEYIFVGDEENKPKISFPCKLSSSEHFIPVGGLAGGIKNLIILNGFLIPFYHWHSKLVNDWLPL